MIFLNKLKKAALLSICGIAILFANTVAFAGESWGVYFPKDGGRPEANATAEHLAQFDAFYTGNENDKVLYVTFDAGYENGFTAPILDVLKKHEVPAAFFLVGTYIRDEPELVKRMVAEGHIVANHTMKHPDMSKIADFDAFAKELALVEDVYRDLIGEEIPKFYRPPGGTYSETNLKHAQQLGYKTIFWSTAYKDWEINNQPSHEEAFSKLMPRTTPGSVILLHNVSKTNAEIMDDLIIRYKDLGYRFETLNHLVGS
ncbi:MAG: polysaccharide deacetylase family protein [Defluviitaleaceae bacterium]|nr:polysaccharide deacetylase family protein [Defluviitaleaceae bacterium]MCL2261715.1 polysaccharide deacetylase family protein [Defluviitaleaceae bacterium]